MNHFLSVAMPITVMIGMTSADAFAVGETYRLTVPAINRYGAINDVPALTEEGNYVALSSDGRYLAYSLSKKAGSPYVIYVRDLLTGTTQALPPGVSGAAITGYPSGISADGRFVAFSSQADNLVADDTNEEFDAFVSDRVTGITRRVSVASDGAQISGCGNVTSYEIEACGSYAGDLSVDGRWASFTTFSRDLPPNNAQQHTTHSVSQPTYSGRYHYVHDQLTGKTQWIDTGGKIRMTADTRYILATDGESPSNTFVHDRLSGQRTMVSVAAKGKSLVCKNSRVPFETTCDGSAGLAISDDGRFVLFYSDLNNQQPGCDGSNGYPSWQFYLHDRRNGQTQCLFSQDYPQSPSAFPRLVFLHFTGNLSANGRYAVFRTEQPLVVNDTNQDSDVYMYDRINRQFEWVSVGIHGKELVTDRAYGGVISADGRKIAFVGDDFVPGGDELDLKQSLYLRDRLIQPEKTVDASVHFEGNAALIDFDGYAENTVLSFYLQPSRPNIAYQLIPSRGYCEQGAIQICHLGDVSDNKRVTVRFELITSPANLESVMVHAHVSTAFTDTYPLNNSADAKIRVK